MYYYDLAGGISSRWGIKSCITPLTLNPAVSTIASLGHTNLILLCVVTANLLWHNYHTF